MVLCLLRLAVTRPHLQAYLCLAKARVEQLRREAGRIEAREIQRRVPTLAGRESGRGLQQLQHMGSAVMLCTSRVLGL